MMKRRANGSGFWLIFMVRFFLAGCFLVTTIKKKAHRVSLHPQKTGLLPTIQARGIVRSRGWNSNGNDSRSKNDKKKPEKTTGAQYRSCSNS